MAVGTTPTSATERLTELRTSARGWQGVQLAVLGFIGLCGVLTDSDPSTPRGVAILAGALALAALALACLGTFLVGRAAWPLYRAGRFDDDHPRELDRASAWLTRGLVLTFTAVALTALSAASGWWPADEPAPAVQAETNGQVVCGTLVADAPGGVLRVDVGGRPLDVPLDALTSVRPVDAC
jgi:hypothetical protein